MEYFADHCARMSKITSDVWHTMLYSCTHMATVGVDQRVKRGSDESIIHVLVVSYLMQN